jgi:RNA polymerase primary sigma factor
VLETLDRIADDYAQLAEMQDSHLGHAERGRLVLGARTRTEYQKLRAEIVNWSTSCTCTTTGSRR